MIGDRSTRRREGLTAVEPRALLAAATALLSMAVFVLAVRSGPEKALVRKPPAATAAAVPAPKVPEALEAKQRTQDREALPAPLSGPRRGGTTRQPRPTPADEVIDLGTRLPVIKNSFEAYMLPASSWLGYADPYWDCWTDNNELKNASQIVTAETAGLLRVEADLPHLWSLEIIDADLEPGQDKHYVAGTVALLSDSAARFVLPMAKGKRFRIVGCNWASPETSIRISYEFDPNKLLESPRSQAGLRNIHPGQLTKLDEVVPVNVVFLGLNQDRIEAKELLDKLPRLSQPTPRIPYFYGIKHSLGIQYRYRYDTVFTSQEYEQRFFDHLKSIGKPTRRTVYQDSYNLQPSRTRTISDNFEIDATAVERWLNENPPPGTDPNGYTMYFINWYGRADFRHHVYSNLGDVDPDVGVDFAESDQSKIIAWGGTPADDPERGFGIESRVWFYDLSAGPDWRTGNWNLRSTDRVFPIWEYGPGAAKPASQLVVDLAKIARYVAIDMLFTPSPLYPPGLTPPRLPESIKLALGTYEGVPGFDGSAAWLKPKEVAKAVQMLLPLNRVLVDSFDLDPKDPTFASCYSRFHMGSGAAPSCAADRPYRDWSSLFVHHALRYEDLTNRGERADYTVLGLLYAMPEQALAYAFADDNQKDGTQSFLHNFMSHIWNGQFGFTSIMTHEAGHHFGLSHPHDGYDWEEDLDFYQSAGWGFVWIGDESSTVMSYLDINNDFSQFDRDNMNRWHSAAYLNSVNSITARILKSPRREDAIGSLRMADSLSGEAKRLFAEHHYLQAATRAKEAYVLVMTAAKKIGVTVPASQTGVSALKAGESLPAYVPPDYAYSDPLSEFALFERLRRRGIAR